MTVTLNNLHIRVEREKGRRSLAWFVRHAFPIVEKTEYKHNWHIDHICTHLEAITKGQLRKLCINVPPGSMKSLLVSVFWPCWEWINDPTLAHLCTSFDIDLTTRDAKKIQDVIQSTWFQQRWGHRIRLKEEGARDFNIYDPTGRSLGGWRFSTSVGGKTTGRHPDRKVIDDPTKPMEATKERLAEVVAWYQNTFRSRGRDPAKVATVIIMQRLDEDDLAGYLMRHEDEWAHVRIPLEYDGRPYQTKWGKDPRTEQGESFWPSRFTPEVCREIKRDTPDPAVYSAQYGQDPTPPSGVIFGTKHFANRWKSIPESGTYIQSWDMAVKGESNSDWVVGQLWLHTENKYYLVDQVRGRLDFTASCKAVVDFRNKWPQALAILIEDKANGPAVINHLSLVEKIEGLIPIKVGNDSKVSRARAVVPLFEASNVLLPERADWVGDYVMELIKFPRGTNDDQVDATSQALTYLVAHQLPDFDAAMANVRNNLQ